jgi:hypothetical protein
MMTTTDPAIRLFEVHVPDEDLADLQRRFAAVRWPSKELVDDRSQGVQLATIQQLAGIPVRCVLSGHRRVASAQVDLLERPGRPLLIRRFGDEFSPGGPSDGCTGPASGGNERPEGRALEVAGRRG